MLHAKFGKIHAVLVTIIYGEMLQECTPINKKPQRIVEVLVLHICHGVTSQVAIGNS